jgi:hypothetical protein
MSESASDQTGLLEWENSENCRPFWQLMSSAIGPKPTFPRRGAMSAFEGKAVMLPD